MAKKRNNRAKREIRQVVINEDGSQSVVDSSTVDNAPRDRDHTKENPEVYKADSIEEDEKSTAALGTEESVYDNSAESSADEVTPIPIKRRGGRLHREAKTSRIHSNVHETRKRGRIAVVAVTLVFSLLLSMCVGSGLALWDSGKTVSDLGDALFNKDVSAAVRDKKGTAKSTAKDKAETADWETLDEVSGNETDSNASSQDNAVSQDNASSKETTEGNDVQETASQESGSDAAVETEKPTDDFTGETLATDMNSGVDSFVKAGSNDEIVMPSAPASQATGLNPNAKYPLPFTTVDESYFTDALFIGDSRLQGFGMWSGLPATYYCATGFSLFKYETASVVQTENGKVPIFDALPYDAFTKIYIKVGLNEMGWDNEKQFEEKYAELIAKLREYEPRAIIYVHAVLPVTAAKSASDSAHNNPNVLKRNEALQAFAAQQKAYYIDAGPALSDENGNLRSEMTSDGIHLSAQYMKLWKQFLCEHAVVVR